jgi:hypothetical protein
MGLHRHNYVRVSAVHSAPNLDKFTLDLGKGHLSPQAYKQAQDLLLGVTTISQRCTVCDKRRLITLPGDLTGLE